MYQVKTTVTHPGSRSRILWNGVFAPKDKKVRVNKEKITEQTTEFVKKNIKLPNTLDPEKLRIKVEITKIKMDFYIVEDKID